MKKKIVILGSTGSIGEQALQIITFHPQRFQVVGLAAGRNIKRLAEQCCIFRPRMVATGYEELAPALQEMLEEGPEVLAGEEGLCQVAAMEEADVVLMALSGAVGIMPTVEALEAGHRVALANKETLVAAGDLVMGLARDHGVPVIPVDSEHSAIFQCIRDEAKYVKNLWLTASGGPFHDYTPDALQRVTPEMALQHPNWSMGKKVTIDSATLMNKGLEVIEAHHLFDVDYDHIKVLVHRQSIVHSMVEFVDGAFLGHLGVPDMRIPIQYALSYPERWNSPTSPLDLAEVGLLQFEKPDTVKFPALELAFQAGRRGGTLPAVMNAANEEAVHSFLTGDLGFTEIPDIIARVMSRHQVIMSPDLAQIQAADTWARDCFRSMNINQTADSR